MRKTLAIVLFALSAGLACAQTAKSRAALYTEIADQLASGQQITALQMRSVFLDVVASAQNITTDGTAVVTGGTYSDPSWLDALHWSKITNIPTSVSGLGVLNGAALDAIAANGGAYYLSRANHTGSQAISTVTGLQAALDAKAAALHTHAIADTTGLQTALDAKANTSALAAVATTGAYADLSGKPTLFDGAYASLTGKPTLFDGAYSSLTGKPTLGTSASLDVPAAGDATTAQVVKGTDTRLSDARTPTTHATTHASAGSDPLTISESQVTNLTADLAAKLATTGTAADVNPAGTNIAAALAGKVATNVAITGATKTKVTYDAKGLVTAGADATTADIADSTNKRYVTDAHLTTLGNTSGTNTGDQNTFSNIVISGQTTVTANSTATALTLVAGGNVTLTTDNTTKTVTIAASASGGGTAWGSITGTLSSQTDLQTALDAKAVSTRTISTTSPLSGGGDLSANRTLTIADAAADGTTKGAATFTAADFNATAGLISIDYTNGQAAATAAKGFLTSTDWNTFNNKVGNTTTISTTSPLSGGGDLSANRTITIADAAADGTTKGAATFAAADFNATAGVVSIDYTSGQAASGSTKGFLTSADWTTFNGKGSGTVTAVSVATSNGISGSSSGGATPALTLAATGRLLSRTIVNAGTTTYTTPAGCTKILVQMIGAGGGGGGCTGSASNAAAGGGGGSGSYAEKIFTVTASTGYTCAVGTGGTAGANTGGTGGTGGSTTITVSAVTVTCNGGLGGVGMLTGTTAGTTALGGAGGAISTNGDLNLPGTAGGWSYRTSGTVAVSGCGAPGLHGSGGAAALITAAAGNNAGNYGAGGGGAVSLANTNRAGGTGGDGVIIVWEFSG